MRAIFQSALAFWFASELALGVFKRAKHSTAVLKDQRSAVLIFCVIGASVLAGAALQHLPEGQFPVSQAVAMPLALALLFTGVVIRWIAILSLGKHFTINVAIQTDHRLIRSGLYGKLRHPSYTGMLLAFLGLGVAFGSWLSLTALLIPIGAAFIYRMHIEEEALLDAFGPEYAEYRESTKRLIPGLY